MTLTYMRHTSLIDRSPLENCQALQRNSAVQNN